MRVLLHALLCLHVVLEGGLGLTLILAPQRVAPEADMNTLTALITYGGAAVTMALVVVWFWPWRQSMVALSVVLGILASFHSMLVVAAVAIHLRGGNSTVLMIHGLLAVGFWLLWFKRQGLVINSSGHLVRDGA